MIKKAVEISLVFFVYVCSLLRWLSSFFFFFLDWLACNH